MAFRVPVRFRFSPGSGMSAWAHAQTAARMGQAFHLNADTVAEERSWHGIDGDVYTCDVSYPSRALALDTWATLTAASVLAWVRPDSDTEGESWADMHECAHDVGGPCPTPEFRWPVI